MTDPDTKKTKHLAVTAPSRWVTRFADLAPVGFAVLDLACGNGRHGRVFMDAGYDVTFLDQNTEALSDLDGARVMTHDLENGAPWPFGPESFGTVVVTNYLHRPLFDDLIASLVPGGILLYETFARGQETFSRPRNPDHLLKSGELLSLVEDSMQVIAYEHGLREHGPTPGVIQRLCASRDLGSGERADGQPPFHRLYPAET